MLYEAYIKLFRSEKVHLGLSHRIPDYANQYWLGQLERAVMAAPNTSFLDIGAGGGRLSILLCSTCFREGTAIETQIDQAAWDELLAEFPNLRLIAGDLLQAMRTEAMGEKRRRYSFVLLSEVFEHIPLPDVRPFLALLQELLTDEGRVFLTTPNLVVQGPAEESPYWHKSMPHGHHKHYLYTDLKELLEHNGFEIVWHCYESHYFKTRIYNRLYYPISRLDYRFLNSQRIPYIVRSIYTGITYPLILVMNMAFWLFAKFCVWIEHRWNNEDTGSTMMILLRKSNDKARLT